MSTVLAAVLLLAAGYAQATVGDFVANRRRLLGLRAFLLALGAALGALSARVGMLDGGSGSAYVFMGFGLVHLPAAFVLFLKTQRGEGRT
jgi:hypothetical protein